MKLQLSHALEQVESAGAQYNRFLSDKTILHHYTSAENNSTFETKQGYLSDYSVLVMTL